MSYLKKITIHISITILLSLLIVLCLYQPIPDIDEQQQYEDIVDTEIIEMMKRYDITGVQLTLFDHEDVKTKTYGYKDLDSKRLIDDQTVFRAQSLSKTITAVLILKLVEEGDIDLDDPLDELLNISFLNQIPTVYHKMTIHHILKHEALMPLGDFNRMFDINDQSMMTLEESLIYDLNQKRPSSGFLYSNVGYNLLEYVINQVYDDGYEALAKTYIFEPLEMANTSFSYDEVNLEDLAYGYDQFKDKVDHYRYPELGSGGLLSTANDYHKFLKGLITNQIITSSSFEKLVTYDSNMSLGSYGLAFDGYGYGVFVEKQDSVLTFSHGGQGLGFMAFYHVNLEDQSGYIVMSNSQRTYPLISMLSATYNDAFGLDDPGIERIHMLMIIFEVLIAITLYLAIFMIYNLIKKTWIKRIISYILLCLLWVLSAIGIIYFMLGNYMFIHVLIPLHFEIWMRTLVLFNLILLIFIIGSFMKYKKNNQLEDASSTKKLSDIKKDIIIVHLALKDQRVSWVVKILFAITIFYALSPIDLIPDFIPILGYFDDILILPFLLKLSLRLIPNEVLEDSRKHYENHIELFAKKQWLYAIPFIIIWLYLSYLILAWIFSA